MSKCVLSLQCGAECDCINSLVHSHVEREEERGYILYTTRVGEGVVVHSFKIRCNGAYVFVEKGV